MALQVLKFGGTSVGSLARIRHVADLVEKRLPDHQVVVVLSAMSGETDRLIEMAQHFSHRPHPRDLDMLLCTGEQRTVALLSICLHEKKIPSVAMLGNQIKILTDGDHTRARILGIDQEKIRAALKKNQVVIIPGFQGVTEDGELTTLGRGGSDTSAVAIAAALSAEACEIYTDVEGVFTTDPNIEPQAQKLEKITFDEMLELASLGAKVLQTRSVEFAKKYNIPIHVRSTFKEVEGTWVVEEMDPMESLVVSGVSYTKNEAKVSVLGMPDRVGLAAELFEMLGREGVLVDVIVQNVSRDGSTDISFTILRDDLPKAMELLKKNQNTLGFLDLVGDSHISKVSVVGNGMRSHSGVAAKMFRCLSEKEITIQMISTSEIKISCVVDESKMLEAVRALHSAFGLSDLSRSEDKANQFKV
jgi:aspartate kinase